MITATAENVLAIKGQTGVRICILDDEFEFAAHQDADQMLSAHKSSWHGMEKVSNWQAGHCSGSVEHGQMMTSFA